MDTYMYMHTVCRQHKWVMVWRYVAEVCVSAFQVNIVVLVYVTFIIVRATRRKEGDACLFL